MKEQHAYSTDNADTIAAFRTAAEAFDAAARRAAEDAETLGDNIGPMVQTIPFGGHRLVGLAPAQPDNPPAGWQYSKRFGYLIPRRGKPGQPARDWLDQHRPPRDARVILADHGLPRHSRAPGDGTRFKLCSPAIFLYDETLWALYDGTPDGDCTWTARRLSEYHAAREAFDARELATAAAEGN